MFKCFVKGGGCEVVTMLWNIPEDVVRVETDRDVDIPRFLAVRRDYWDAQEKLEKAEQEFAWIESVVDTMELQAGVGEPLEESVIFEGLE